MPQFGIQDADVVYEEIVEGGITRLAAIFNSRTPTVVGPVRSVSSYRSRDRPFPLVGSSRSRAVHSTRCEVSRTAPVKLYDQFQRRRTPCFATPTRPTAPQPLCQRGTADEKKDGLPRPPPALFTYRSAGQKRARAPCEVLRGGFLRVATRPPTPGIRPPDPGTGHSSARPTSTANGARAFPEET
jgi:hypothetical protein